MTDLNPDHYKFRRTSGLRAHDFRNSYASWRRRWLLLSAVAKIEVFAVFVIICALVFLALRSA